MARLKPGDMAPAFEAVNQNGESIALSDFTGRKLFVYFYPKANTAG